MSVLQNLFAYFALYTLSGELDALIDLKKAKKTNFDSILLSAVAIQTSLLIQLVRNYRIRKAIALAKGDESGSTFLGATGLTTVFNALTQTTTTLCANG